MPCFSQSSRHCLSWSLETCATTLGPLDTNTFLGLAMSMLGESAELDFFAVTLIHFVGSLGHLGVSVRTVVGTTALRSTSASFVGGIGGHQRSEQEDFRVVCSAFAMNYGIRVGPSHTSRTWVARHAAQSRHHFLVYSRDPPLSIKPLSPSTEERPSCWCVQVFCRRASQPCKHEECERQIFALTNT